MFKRYAWYRRLLGGYWFKGRFTPWRQVERRAFDKLLEGSEGRKYWAFEYHSVRRFVN